MNVLSLFDGMSCGQIALNRLGIKYYNYYAAEIDKYAIEVTKKNFPNTIHLGDVTKVKATDLEPIDLLMGGSPCQGFSFAGKQLNFDDPRSALFFEFVRLLKECKPKYFLLENVRMKKNYQDVITEHLGVEPIIINSSLLSAQNRLRLYWTNIPNIDQPKDKKILLKDILQYEAENEYEEPYVKLNGNKEGCVGYVGKQPKQATRIYDINNKSQCLTALGGGQGGKTGLYKIPTVDRDKSHCLDAHYYKGASWEQYKKKSRRQLVKLEEIDKELPDKSHVIKAQYYKSSMANFTSKTGFRATGVWTKDNFRKLTPIECERLQTVPDNYTQGVSNTQRYKMLGNGWTVDVITHILKNIHEENNNTLQTQRTATTDSQGDATI